MNKHVKQHVSGHRLLLAGAALAGALALSGCGQSNFAKQLGEICSEPMSDGTPRSGLPGYSGMDCGCVAEKLDKGVPEKLKPAFVALQWPLRPDPRDREAVNGAMLREAGIDPTDRRAITSAVAELRETLHPQIREQCKAG
jgi:hypothetical protein